MAPDKFGIILSAIGSILVAFSSLKSEQTKDNKIVGQDSKNIQGAIDSLGKAPFWTRTNKAIIFWSGMIVFTIGTIYLLIG